MALVTDLSSITYTGLSGSDIIHVVDVSDSTDNAAGTSRKCTLGDISDYSLPTAAYLSTGTNLQTYINEQISKTHRTGPIWLPKGDITVSSQIVIQTPSSNPINGISLQGAGPSYERTGNSGTFAAPNASQSTRIVSSVTGSTSAFKVLGTDITFRDLAIEATTNCIEVTDNVSDVNNGMYLENITFLNATRGFYVKAASGTFGPSNISFNNCVFKECTNGFVNDSTNSRNFNFNNCKWIEVTNAIQSNANGNVRAYNSNMRDGTVFLTVNSGGAIKAPYIISGLNITRRDDDTTKPIVLEGTNAGDTLLCDIEGVGIEFLDSDRQNISDISFTTDFSNHIIYRLPNSAPANVDSSYTIGHTFAPYGTTLTPDNI